MVIGDCQTGWIDDETRAATGGIQYQANFWVDECALGFDLDDGLLGVGQG
jgi:hypothetical protein